MSVFKGVKNMYVYVKNTQSNSHSQLFIIIFKIKSMNVIQGRSQCVSPVGCDVIQQT